ncbi:hypothetical protein JL49_08170 [Pseudoalteromonas luteoviolacea]|nr:hypothetical protein JL49_08170 [Pseudoalteromonas luteoviolacea]
MGVEAMELDILFLVIIIGIVIRLYCLVSNLKEAVKFDVVEHSFVRLVDTDSNVMSITHATKDSNLKQGGMLLMQSEALEKMFEHADSEELLKYELQFRFERRRFLKRMQENGIIDLQKERAEFLKQLKIKL